jgi:pyrroloquinoline quinone biosynthesis protein B
MRVRLLGTAAGGGFPQWNCGCRNCLAARADPTRARPRSQSCVAVSSDGRRWFLVNASPDIRAQIESFPALLANGVVRGTGIEGILLTGADLDHTLGLFLLREGGRLTIHATSSVRAALDAGLRLTAVLDFYGGVEWREPPTGLAPLCLGDGRPSGLRYAAFAVPGKPPRYREGQVAGASGDCVGYRIVDEATGGTLVCVPGVADLSAAVVAEFRNNDVLLLDGTFWSEDELVQTGACHLLATAMGHLPVSGSNGSLARVGPLPMRRKIYVHVNNTNPMLLEDSPERRAVEAAGMEIGADGLDFDL